MLFLRSGFSLNETLYLFDGFPRPPKMPRRLSIRDAPVNVVVADVAGVKGIQDPKRLGANP
jgi:hypothetical protein